MIEADITQYETWLTLYRSGQMTDEDFHARMREDEDFRRWAEEQARKTE